MSGGSFNYLCYEDNLEGLLAKTSDLSDMADALAELGYAADAAQETAALLATVRATSARIEASARRLSSVWKAMEWWQSCDRSEEQFKESLAKYRGENYERRTTYQLTVDEVAVVDALRKAKGGSQ